MSLQVALAGQLRVSSDGTSLDGTRLAGRQGRVVLACLVSERHRPVPIEELAEAIWGASPPPTWRTALRGAISSVRAFLRLLGLPAAELLTASSGCYQLNLPDDTTVDVELAARDAEVAIEALEARDLPGAVAAARSARAVARSPLLPGLDSAWIERRRALLHETLVRSLEVLADAHLGAQHGPLAVESARELVQLEPFRESAHLRLVRALAAAGDRGEALRAFERCRRLLAEELGIDPSPELEVAYLDVLRAEPSDEPPPGGREPQARQGDLFVGRATEMGHLRTAWEGARAGRRRGALIMGEAGIGKSRLVAEVTAAAVRDGAVVLSGSCEEHLRVAYLPLRQAIGHHLATRTPEQLEELVDRGGPWIQRWPELAWRVEGSADPGSGPGDQSYLLSETFVDLLRAIAAGAAVVLVLEDVQWADDPSLELVRHLARAPAPAGLLLLVTCRTDEELSPGVGAALADLARAPWVADVPLASLQVSEVAAMVDLLIDSAAGRRSGTGRDLSAGVLHRHTGGNPFLVRELLRHLTETGEPAGADPAPSAAGVADDDVPPSVRLVVGHRLARLPGRAGELVEAAAVVGDEVDIAVLARVVDIRHAEVVAALDAATRAGLLDECPGVPGRYVFRHPIVHDAVYVGLPAGRRALLHHRVGTAIEAAPGGSSRLRELADHFALGSEPTDAGKAVDYARRAGDEALAELRYEDSADSYRRALAGLDRTVCDDGHRRELHLALAEALAGAGRPAAAEEVLREAGVAGGGTRRPRRRSPNAGQGTAPAGHRPP
jgi:DNA-binding SARP family transcriptional activator